MIEYDTAMRIKLVTILFTVMYCMFGFVDVMYPVRLMMFSLLAYHLHLWWEDTVILEKGAKFNV